ncbi:DUF2798 domain-containing protein [Caenispirillum bisanense]|uniref:DUF2798 domain-containing protein n=1 Tax=Caenispirillum bisanense TaxID=414052 RepID=A0A286GJ66_9PROT|nr:DUF2798 domain-containing protein [Caenispirillum bisanense]SOD95522.1 Protein of unknown function [Caenispirillum bisanense]
MARRKLPARAQVILTPMILSLLMSGVVSAVATLTATGLAPGVTGTILHAWGLSYVIACPTAIVVLPLVRRIVGLLVESPA